MNIVFLGSSEFAVKPLKAIFDNGYNVACVFTQPDRAKGRGRQICATPVKKLCQDLGIKTYQPQDINDSVSLVTLKKIDPDLLVVIAYGQILSSAVIKTAKIMAFNMHASLLPKYRGAAPVNWALINGEKYTGVSAIKINTKMDAGPVICQKSIQINESDTAVTLAEKLSELSAELVIKVLSSIPSGKYTLIPQEESKVTYARKLKKEDGLIEWSKHSRAIINHVRGCLGWPGSYSYLNGKLLRILELELVNDSFGSGYKPGQILEVSKAGIVVKTGDGAVTIKELQAENKKAMKAGDFIAGHKVILGDVFKNCLH